MKAFKIIQAAEDAGWIDPGFTEPLHVTVKRAEEYLANPTNLPIFCEECGERQNMDGEWHKPSCSKLDLSLNRLERAFHPSRPEVKIADRALRTIGSAQRR